MPKLIKNWSDLAKVEPTDNYYLDITPKNGNGWVMNRATGKSESYLSTHTFYGSNHQNSTIKLQRYGFDVVIDNWDSDK